METQILPPDILRATCGSRSVLDLIADKWTVLVLCALGKERVRFSELGRRVQGISQKMLTHTVRVMERNGLVERTVLASVPPHVDYALTPLGRTLADSVECLRRWAETNMAAVEAAQAAYDLRTTAEPAVR
jgi:DNA-binding HxlR family transcriptional regulator